MLCSEALSVNIGGNETLVSVLRCKRWSCEICQPFNRLKVVQAAKRGYPNIFLTLTCNPARYASRDQAANDMKRSLILLRRRIFKRYGIKNMPFIVIFERTKKGWPHMHILARANWLDQKWLSDQMRELTDAPIVDVRKIQDQGRAAAYVSKYVGKDPFAFAGCKRWWRSHNYEIEKEVFEPLIKGIRDRYEISDNIDDYKDRLRTNGWNIIEEGRNWVLYEHRAPP